MARTCVSPIMAARSNAILLDRPTGCGRWTSSSIPLPMGGRSGSCRFTDTSTLANVWVGCRSPGHHACLGVQSQRLRTATGGAQTSVSCSDCPPHCAQDTTRRRLSWRDYRGRRHALGRARRTVPHQVVTAESVKEDHRPAFWDASPSDRHKPTPVDVAHR